MEARIVRSVFAEEAGWVSRIIPANPSSGNLRGMLIDATGQHLRLSANDGLASSTTSIDASITAPGKALVPGKLLAAITGSLPQQPVTITAEDNKLSIACGKSRFALPTMPVDGYPEPPDQPHRVGSVTGNDFAAAVTQTAVAAAKDETMPILTGIQVRATGTELIMVATDRYRLAVKHTPWEGVNCDPFIIRARNLMEIAKPASPNTVEFSMDPGASIFGATSGARRSTVPLIDGAYPDIERIIPTSHELVVTVDVVELIEAAKRVRLVMDRAKQPLQFTIGNDEVLLSTASGTTSTANESVDADISGERMEIAFNPEYLVEALAALAGPVARFSMTTPAKPVLIDAPDDPSYRHVLMPVRID